MDSSAGSTPLPMDGLIRDRPPDPAVVERTIGLSDPRVADWLKAGAGSGAVAAQTAKGLRERIIQALTQAGFRVSFEALPSFEGAWKHGATGRSVTGRVVGEAALSATTEGVESRRKSAKIVGAFGLAFAVAVGALLAIVAPGAVFAGILGGLGIAACGALPYVLTFGTFDSDVVAVTYSGTWTDSATKFDENSRTAFQVSAAAGRVRTRNGAGKGHQWRNVTATLPAPQDLGFLPGQILDAVGAQ